MGRGLAYNRHQENKHKKRTRDVLHAVWLKRSEVTKSPDAVQFPRRWYTWSIITDRDIGIRSKSNNPLGCTCSSWCKPEYNMRLQHHIDSHGKWDNHQSINSDPYHGY